MCTHIDFHTTQPQSKLAQNNTQITFPDDMTHSKMYLSFRRNHFSECFRAEQVVVVFTYLRIELWFSSHLDAKKVKSFVIPFMHNQGTHPQLTWAASQEIVRPFLRVRGDSFAGRDQSFSHDMYFLAQQHQPDNGSQKFFCVPPM